MGEPSIFDKLRARKRLMEGVMPDQPRAAMPVAKPVGATKRVMTRDPATNKIVWIDVPDV